MLCTPYTLPAVLPLKKGPLVRSGKRPVSSRSPVPVSDTPAMQRLPSGCNKTTAATPLAERLTSLPIGHTHTPISPRSEAATEVGPARSSAPAHDSAHALQAALSVLAFDGLCSPEQVATLKKEYGSLKMLMPYLGKTFVSVDGLPLPDDEWMSVLKQYPLAIDRVPKELHVEDDSFYIQALCASAGSAEVVALLPAEHKEKLCDLAFDEDSTLIGLLPASERTPEICEQACIKRPKALAHVPDKIQTEAFLLRLCDQEHACFRYIDDSKKQRVWRPK